MYDSSKKYNLTKKLSSITASMSSTSLNVSVFAAVIAAFAAMTKEPRPSHRFDSSVKKNQEIIDALDKHNVVLLMEVPIECFIFLVEEIKASDKARREKNPMQNLYWIFFSYKLIAVMMKRLQEFPLEVQIQLGQIFEYGDAYCLRQGKNAVRAYEAAAQQGSSLAEYYLGNIYHDGKAVKKNDDEAVRWYTRAAAKGHVYALDTLKKMQQQN
jgi:hypothetical protein